MCGACLCSWPLSGAAHHRLGGGLSLLSARPWGRHPDIGVRHYVSLVVCHDPAVVLLQGQLYAVLEIVCLPATSSTGQTCTIPALQKLCSSVAALCAKCNSQAGRLRDLSGRRTLTSSVPARRLFAGALCSSGSLPSASSRNPEVTSRKMFPQQLLFSSSHRPGQTGLSAHHYSALPIAKLRRLTQPRCGQREGLPGSRAKRAGTYPRGLQSGVSAVMHFKLSPCSCLQFSSPILVLDGEVSAWNKAQRPATDQHPV